MKQTRKASLAESLMNVAIGYGVALGAQIVVFPWFGINIPLSSNITIGLIFTAVSIARSFAVRRMFEAIRVRREKTMIYGKDKWSNIRLIL